MRRNQSGQIIVEASIVLPFFMFAVLSIIMLTIPCIAQARVSTALNQAVYEYSQDYYKISTVDKNALNGDLRTLIEHVSPLPDETDYFDVSGFKPATQTKEIADTLFRKNFNASSSDNELVRSLQSFGISNFDLSFTGSAMYKSQNKIAFALSYDIAPFSFLGINSIKFHQYKRSEALLWSR